MAGEPNPFATRYIRPGAVSFLFEPGESTAEILQRLARQGWWGQIVGPHGSGKSTLLAGLLPSLTAAGRTPCMLTLRQGERQLPPLDVALTASVQLVVDGFEQLSWFSRHRLRARCRRAGAGLLVTAHRDMGLPTVFSTRPSERLASAVVAKLLPTDQTAIRDEDIRSAYAATGGNIRETLFRLYDVYERAGS